MSPMSPRLLRPRASGGFDPRSISNLAAWYDVADTNNVVINTGVTPNTISQLTDKSGNGRNATQTGAFTTQPQISRAAFSGKDVAAFTSARSMNMSVPLTATTTVFLVATKSSVINTFIFGGTVGGNSPAITSEYSDVDFAYYTPGDVLITILANGLAGLNVIAFTHQDATNLTLYANGAFVSTRTPSAGYPYNGNSLNKLNGSGYTGSIAEFLVYQKIFSASERSAVTAYLGAKWGVAVT